VIVAIGIIEQPRRSVNELQQQRTGVKPVCQTLPRGPRS